MNKSSINHKLGTLAPSPVSKAEIIINMDYNCAKFCFREFIENTIAMRHQKMTVSEHTQLTDLLIAKDKEIKETLVLAKSQARIVKKMEALKAEVDRHDIEIQALQRQFKEAEQVLSTAIFQAQQKLASINKANKRPVLSEQLIKFAYGISASNAVCAPLTWQPGDPRRPYPIDMKMRAGFLGRSDISHNGVGTSQSISEITRPGQVPGG